MTEMNTEKTIKRVKGDCIRPGKYIYDTEGKPVQAHGGSIFYENDTFYWYGENKEGVTGRAVGGNPAIWHNGVKMYSSKDLYNWKDEGVLIVDNENPDHPFYPGRIMDRPHIIFCPKTKKYVMWAKIADLLGGQGFDVGYYAVAESDKINGKYTVVNKETRALPGDFDLFTKDDKAYIVYEYPHTETIVRSLSEDFRSFGEEISHHQPAPYPPFAREAAAYFTRGGKGYLLTSGTTGYFPNESEIAEIDNIHGEWKNLGNACRGDKNKNSFHAQFSSVFKHPKKKDLYIALGDRWLVDLPPEYVSGKDLFESWFNPEKEKLPETLLKEYTDENTSLATYVWLPVRFDEKDMPYIEWQNEWKIEDFKDE